MKAITILQFSPVPAYFCCGWVKSPIYASYRKKGKDDIKIEDNLNSFENLKNIDNLKNENELKKEYDLTNEDEDDLIYGDDLRNIALMWQMATNKYWKGK